MNVLKPRIHDDSNGLDYVLVGDYYIPDLKLPEERRPIGKWGRMHLRYPKEHRPITYTELTLSSNREPTLLTSTNRHRNGWSCS